MKNLSYLIFVVVLLMKLVACNSVGREYERLAGSRITFPENLQRVSERDTLSFDCDDSKVRLLIYFDSTMCHSCAISKLDDWGSIIDSAKLINSDFEAIFLLSPSHLEYKKVLREMMLQPSEYNIVLDSHNEFPKHNPHIPKDTRFHTMLLDKKNRVIVVGSPLYNPSIWNLTKEMLKELNK